VFLILWEILDTPDTSIFLIDEPEAHLHRGITDKLWNEIERIRPWSLFIYATHDLSFATTRRQAEIIYLEKYKAYRSRWLAQWDGRVISPVRTDTPLTSMLILIPLAGYTQ